MKKIKFILAAFAVAMLSLNAVAQENGNRDADGHVVRGPYLTNTAGSNWFIGAGGGFNTSFALGVSPFAEFSPKNNWAAEAFVGKWFTPSVGVRAGYKGVMNNFGFHDGAHSPVVANGEQIRFGYAHADLMWNVSNAFGGYKETRFWDIIPYVGGGYLGINNGHTENKLGVSGGIYNELRLGDVVNLYIDLSLLASEGFLKTENAKGDRLVSDKTFLLKRPTYMPSATVGVTFNLSQKKNFDRYSSVAPLAELAQANDALAALKERNAGLQQENALLRDQLVEAQNKQPEKVVVKEEVQVLVGSTVITFAAGSDKLTQVEKQKVEMFAKSFSDKDVVVKVVGSADSKTGSAKLNNKLSQNRANVVKDVLVKNGVAAERITATSTLDATENVETSRSAIITLE